MNAQLYYISIIHSLTCIHINWLSRLMHSHTCLCFSPVCQIQSPQFKPVAPPVEPSLVPFPSLKLWQKWHSQPASRRLRHGQTGTKCPVTLSSDKTVFVKESSITPSISNSQDIATSATEALVFLNTFKHTLTHTNTLKSELSIIASVFPHFQSARFKLYI